MYARPIWSDEKSTDAIISVLIDRPCSADELVHSIQGCPSKAMHVHLSAMIGDRTILKSAANPPVYTVNIPIGARNIPIGAGIVIGAPPVSWVSESREHFVRGRR